MNSWFLNLCSLVDFGTLNICQVWNGDLQNDKSMTFKNLIVSLEWQFLRPTKKSLNKQQVCFSSLQSESTAKLTITNNTHFEFGILVDDRFRFVFFDFN